MKKILTVLLISSIFLFATDNKDFEFLLQEEKIKDFYYDKSFKKITVQVEDDGTKRDGFAQYIGLVLKDKNLDKHVNLILVKDIKCPKSKIKNGECKYLGKARVSK